MDKAATACHYSKTVEAMLPPFFMSAKVLKSPARFVLQEGTKSRISC